MNRFGTLLLIIDTLAIAGVAKADCRSDKDCAADKICIQGACVDATALPPPPPPPPGAAPAPSATEAAPEPPVAPGSSTPEPSPASAAPRPRPAPAATTRQSENVARTPSPSARSPEYTVPVRVGGWDGYVVRSTTRNGRTVECKTPCTLQLSPGRAEIEVVDYFTYSIEVPDHAATADISLRRTGLIGTGVAFSVLGALTAAYGVNEKVKSNQAYDDCLSRRPTYGGASGQTYYMGDCDKDDSGDMILALGVAALAGGAGMLVPGLVSKNAITVSAASDSARVRPGNFTVGLAPRREGGGVVSGWFTF